jgi:predicted small lipoprotein YifL
MSGRAITWLFFVFLLLLIVMGCGRKAPPTLPEKPSSLSLEFETGVKMQKPMTIRDIISDSAHRPRFY